MSTALAGRLSSVDSPLQATGEHLLPRGGARHGIRQHGQAEVVQGTGGSGETGSEPVLVTAPQEADPKVELEGQEVYLGETPVNGKEERDRQERGGGPGGSEKDSGPAGGLGAWPTSKETTSGAVTGLVTVGWWPHARDFGHRPPHYELWAVHEHGCLGVYGKPPEAA